MLIPLVLDQEPKGKAGETQARRDQGRDQETCSWREEKEENDQRIQGKVILLLALGLKMFVSCNGAGKNKVNH